tara:strand:+ start:392 stop:1411 length:1020 start_codon:yes stop_codon:yes gene_type:complete
MNQLALSIPFLSALSAFILIFWLRFLDVFEREPYKFILLNFILGIAAYPFSALVYSYLLELSNIDINPIQTTNTSIYFAVLSSSFLMLISQVITGLISFTLSKKEYDTVTDYIIYFSTIGIGYNFSEVFFYHFLNKTTDLRLLELSQNLYYSSFFSGTTLPFIMAGIGMGFYLIRIAKKNNILFLGYLLLIFSFLVQILFYSMNYFILIGMPIDHLTSNHINLIKEIKFFANNLSLMLLISGVGFSVLLDNYIISTFYNAVITYSKFDNADPQKLNLFSNPFSYILSYRFRSMLKINQDYDISDRELSKFAKLALKNFNDKNNTSIYINEASSILVNLN